MIWHNMTKKLIKAAVEEQGIHCYDDYKVVTKNSKSWTSDIYFEVKDQQFVIEIQHLYRPLSQYLNRQKSLEDSGMKSYWILPVDLYSSLLSTTGKFKKRSTFSGTRDLGLPSFRCLDCLPVVSFKFNPIPEVIGDGELKCDLKNWIKAILHNKFLYEDGAWVIETG